MHKFEDAAYREFAEVLREHVAAHAPDWTDLNESDPGIVLVELFAFLPESLLYRDGQRGCAGTPASRRRQLVCRRGLQADAGGRLCELSTGYRECQLDRKGYHARSRKFQVISFAGKR